MGVETAIAAAVTSLVSGYGAYKERQVAKHQQTLQRNALNDAEAKEREKRRNLIDRQREQLLGGNGGGTRGYSTAGIKVNIGDKLG